MFQCRHDIIFMATSKRCNFLSPNFKLFLVVVLVFHLSLDRAHRRAAKIVLKTNDLDAETELKWLPLSMRHDMHTINLTFKCLKGCPPVFFKDYFKVFRTIHNTRGSGHNLLLPKVRTETARKSFYFNGSKLLNSIASEVKDAKSVVIFKTRFLELYRSKVF